jgi:AraC-like DNA-binding protein
MKIQLFILFLFAINLTSAQKTGIPENLYLELESKARLMINSNIDSSMFYADKIGQSRNSLHQAFSAGLKSYLYQIEGDTKRADELYKRAFVLLDKSQQSNEKLRVHSVILNYGGLIGWKRKRYSEALTCFEKGRKISIKISDQIQLIKFSNNMSKLNIEAGNFVSAIRASKYSDRVSTKIRDTYSEEGFENVKSNVYFNLGYSYAHFGYQKADSAAIDSAIYYYNKAIDFSDLFEGTKLSAEMNIASLYAYKKQRKKAEKMYFHLLKVCKENNYVHQELTLVFNLGLNYYKSESYVEALSFFQQVDSIHTEYEIGDSEYTYSNFYKADIYEKNGDYDKAERYLLLFLKDFDEMERLHKGEVLELNYLSGQIDLRIAAKLINEKIQSRRNQFYLTVSGIALILIVMVFLLRKNIKDKNKARVKLKKFKEEFQQDQVQKKKVYSNTIQSFSINDDKEQEILISLEKIIKKEYYLKRDFSLQSAAKKIKTNTTYLAHVVNKNYGKSFSEYSNELKVNYVIRQLMENMTYRKYYTQAMAESVGYKSAISFTKSFKKRTGVTPVQFLKSIE